MSSALPPGQRRPAAKCSEIRRDRGEVSPDRSTHHSSKTSRRVLRLEGRGGRDSNFPPIATGCVAARRAKVWRASALAVKSTSAHAIWVGTSVGIPGRKFDTRVICVPKLSADFHLNLQQNRPDFARAAPAHPPPAAHLSSPIQAISILRHDPPRCQVFRPSNQGRSVLVPRSAWERTPRLARISRSHAKRGNESKLIGPGH